MKAVFPAWMLATAVLYHAPWTEAQVQAPPNATAIPFAQLGAEAQKQYSGDGIGITPSKNGATLKAAFQRLEGQATSEGLWLTSTADEDKGKDTRFRVRATAIGRDGNAPRVATGETGWDGASPTRLGGCTSLPSRIWRDQPAPGTSRATPPLPLPSFGEVRATKDSAAWLRPGLIEEYSASMDGIRQDFVVLSPPDGRGELAVSLELTGIRAEAAAYGAKLVISGSGRELAYSRLRVTDATGRELQARMEVRNARTLAVQVDDRGAAYPVRIDPTFSDADWISMGDVAGVDGNVLALALDSSGNLYVGGLFTAAGNVIANRIAKWDGSSWSALGSGMDNTVRALATRGMDLYAGGDFTTAGGVPASHLAKWDGSNWSAVGAGTDGPVSALATADLTALFVGGNFTSAGGVAANNIVLFNGGVWSPLSSGVNGFVRALAAPGSGIVYAGGSFTTAGGATVNYVARWNGSSWTALGSGMDSPVYALALSGTNLYAGGIFSLAGGSSASYIAKWNGSSWNAVGSGMNERVTTLAVSGTDLYAGGYFTTAGGAGANRIAKWNGSAWSSLGSGNNNIVFALAVSETNLFAGGQFSTAGGANTSRIARWSGGAWSSLGTGSAMNDIVHALAVSGTDLYAGGYFTAVGGVSANYLAKWNGSAWSAVGSGTNGPVYTLATADATALFVGGSFTMAGGVAANNIVLYNGGVWSALSSGMNSPVYSLAAPGSGVVYAGGTFTTAGGASANRIARWNGSSWTALGSGMNNNVAVLALSGTDVYAGGGFTTAGGASANYIAKWNGSSWSTLGSGMNSGVIALAVSGTDLYAGGGFTTAGGASANYIAKWNGSSWSALGAGMNNEVRALAFSGTDLYAGGLFTTAGGASANYIAKWNGSAWSALGAGMNYFVEDLVVSGTDLYAGGGFTTAGGKVSAYLARADLSAEIFVTGNGVEIVDGNSTPSTADHTDFGQTPVTGGTVIRTFTVLNDGFSPLTLGAVSLGGTHPGDFTVTAQPVTPVAPGATTTFQVSFDPSASGARSATLSFSNNDTDENPFNFAIQGTGTAPPTVTSPTSTAVTASGATLGGTVTSDGSDAITERGVVFAVTATNDNPAIDGTGVTKVTASGTTGTFTVPVTGLAFGTGYSYKAFATNSLGTVYTTVATFTTLNTAPVVTLTGSNPLVVEAAATYTDPGATAADAEEGALTPTVTGNTVVPNVPGPYSVQWTATDSLGLTGSATRTVTVVDTTAPVISNVPATIVVNTPNPGGTAVTYAPATATDVVGVTSLTYSHPSGSTFPIGVTAVTITAADAANNSASTQFTVTVRGTPTVTLTGGNPLTFEAAATYTDPGATATDPEDGALTPIITSNTVVANMPGTYAVTWMATDSGGFTGTATRTVNVVDTTAPDTAILSGPADPSSSTDATLTFDGTDGGSGVAFYESRLDGGPFATATSPQSFTGLPEGSHTFAVRAVDHAGNTDASPASYTWNIVTVRQIGADIDGEAAGDFSGYGGALAPNSNGQRVVIGAPYNDGNGANSGHARVFDWTGSVWVQRGSDIDGEAAGDSSGRAVAMSADGNTIAIGAYLNDGNGTDAGQVRVYTWNGAAWIQKGGDVDGQGPGDWFGQAVAISADGNTFIAGAYQDLPGQPGYARVYSWNGSAWAPKGAVLNGEAAGDFFGISVDINASGDSIIIGAIFNDGNGTDSGHARVFAWNGSAWVQKGVDLDGEAAGDAFGSPVAMTGDGNTIFIGGPANDGTGPEAGHARVFAWNGSAWVQKGADLDGEAAGDFSGVGAISEDGNRIAIGAYLNDGNGTDSGHVRLYAWNGSAWVQRGFDLNGEASGDWSGIAVAMSADGNIFFAGAFRNDGNGVDSGHVRAHVLNRVPDIAVSGNGVDIADGDVSPVLSDHTDFGSTPVAGGTVTRTFTVSNPGTADLTLGTVTLSGANSADFGIASAPASSVAAGETITFQVTFDPPAAGTRSATVSFGTNDADENPFNFAILGTGANSDPTDVILSASSLAENTPAGSAVGTLAAADPDAGDSHTFSLATGTGDADNGSFLIDGPALHLTPSADFETKSSYAIRIRATDSGVGNLTMEKQFTILITDVNETPAFTKGPDQTAPVSATSTQAVAGWATGIDDGDGMVAQSLTFNVSVTSGAGLFTTPPAVSPLGTLTYTPNGTAGTATVSVTLTDDATINGTAAITTAAQSFTITTNTPTSLFDDAASDAGLTGDAALPEAAPFADGVTNLLKYAFNLELSGPDSHEMAAGGTSGLPAIDPQGSGAGRTFRFEYVRRLGSGLIYTPQFSGDLQAGSWEDVAAPMDFTETVTPIDIEWQRVVVEVAIPDESSEFGRVQVTAP